MDLTCLESGCEVRKAGGKSQGRGSLTQLGGLLGRRGSDENMVGGSSSRERGEGN